MEVNFSQRCTVIEWETTETKLEHVKVWLLISIFFNHKINTATGDPEKLWRHCAGGLENLLWGKTEGGLFSPWRWEGSGGPHHSISVPKKCLQRRWQLSHHKEPHGKDMGKCVQVALGEFSSLYKKGILTVRTITGTISSRTQLSHHHYSFLRRYWTGC